MSQIQKTDKVAVAKRIDEIASGAMELFGQAGSFEQELQVAEAISNMRAVLTPEIMQPVMALMNTDLGFRTDRDPANPGKDGQPLRPYGVDVVRECFIECKLRGFHTIGNEFNIISGRFYGTQNGFVRKVKNFPGVTNLKEWFDVPRLVGDKGAIVKCSATWTRDGSIDKIEREFAVKVNSFMGSDAVLGKARRKLFKAIHDQLTGQFTPEGEIGETIEVEGKTKPENVVERAAAKMAKEQEKAKESPPTNGSQPREVSPQEALASIITAEAHSFDDFRRWYRESGRKPADSDTWADFGEIPTPVAAELVEKRLGVLSQIKMMGVR